MVRVFTQHLRIQGKNVKEIIRKPAFSSQWNHHFSYISRGFNTTILPNTSTKNGAFHRQRSSPCWAWWSTTVGCSIGATPLSLWHLGAAPGEHGERTWGHGQFVAIDISKISVSISYIYVCVCFWNGMLTYVYTCYIYRIMRVARVDAYCPCWCILKDLLLSYEYYTYIYIYCYIIYDVQLMREATLASWKILYKYRFQWEHHR